MIAKVQPSRQHSSSFKRLQEYLTKERDLDTGELILRGDVVIRMVVKTAARHGISVEFTDPLMQHTLRLLQHVSNPLQRQQ